MKSLALRIYASFLLIAAQAFQVHAAGEEIVNGNDGKPSSSVKTPWHEPRPFVETLRHPKYDNHAYHNPFPDPNGEDLSKKRYRAYEGTRITGPGKSREPDPDGDMEARLMMMLKDRKKVDHVLKEMDRRRQLPGDPFGTGGKRQLKGIPEFRAPTWITNMTTIQFQTKAPAWHGWFALRMATNCDTCKLALSAADVWAHRVWKSHDLRLCAQFAVIDVLKDPFQSPAAQLQAAGSRPVLHWVPPLHEHHGEHQATEMFSGPWTMASMSAFINKQCARTARIGRVYAADILATHFANATSKAAQRSALEGLQLLQMHHSDGHEDAHAKEFFRFYADIMEDALEATIPVEQYIDAEVARVEKWLLGETFHDALTEVMAIKLNVLQAFRQSAAHPDDVHFGLDADVSDDDYGQDSVDLDPRTEADIDAVLAATS